MQCRNCGSKQFIPGQNSDMVVCRECGEPGDSSTGRPYRRQPGGTPVTPSDMDGANRVMNIPGQEIRDDFGGNPLGTGLLANSSFLGHCPNCGSDDIESGYCRDCRSNIWNDGMATNDIARAGDTMNAWDNNGGNSRMPLADSDNWQPGFRRDDLWSSKHSGWGDGSGNRMVPAPQPGQYRVEQLQNGFIRVDDRASGMSGLYNPDGSVRSGQLGPLPASIMAQITGGSVNEFGYHMPPTIASWNNKLKMATDFEVSQVITPGEDVHTVEVEQDGELPLILQHDNPDVLDEAKSALKSSGLLGDIGGLLGAGGFLGDVLAPETGGLSLIPGALAGGLLGKSLGDDVGGVVGDVGNALGMGGGVPEQMGNNLNTLASMQDEPSFPLDSDLGQSFLKAFPAMAEYAHRPESGAEHPDIAQFANLFEQSFPGLKDQPIRPEHQAEIDSLRPQHVSKSIYDVIHEAAFGQVPQEEKIYGQPPSQMGPNLDTNDISYDVADDMTNLLSRHPDFAPIDAASIISQRTGIPPEQIVNLYDQQTVNDWQYVRPEMRPQQYRQQYEPSNFPPQWEAYGEPPQGAHALSSYPPQWGDSYHTSADDGFGYDSPNTRRFILDTEDPHGDGIDAAVHGENPGAWQRMDNMQGGGSDEAPPYDINHPIVQTVLQLIQQHAPELLRSASLTTDEADPNYMEMHPQDTQFPTVPPKNDPAQANLCPKCGSRLNGMMCPFCQRSLFQMMSPQVPQPNQQGQAQQQQIMQSPNPYLPKTLGHTAGLGPSNIEQIMMIQQYMEANGQWSPEVADQLVRNPNDPMFAEALARIQQKGTVPPMPDPSQPPPPMPPPEGGPPGGAPGGPPPTTTMQASRIAADTAAAKCPNCDGHTTTLLDEDGNCKCDSCHHRWKMKLDPGDERHQYGSKNSANIGLWQTEDGQPLQPGMSVEMYRQGSPIPDTITINDVKPNSIVYTLPGAYGLNHQTEITRDEADVSGLTFRASQSQQQAPPTNMAQEPPEVERNTNDDNTGFVGPTEGVDNLSIQSSMTKFCNHCDSPYEYDPNSAHTSLCYSCAFDTEYGDGLLKSAGKDYSRSEQLALINEPGIARNLSSMDISQTHYVLDEDPDAEAIFW